MSKNNKNNDPQTKIPLHPQKRSFFASLAWGFVVFVIILGLLESLAGTNLLNRVFKTRSVGNYHTQFEIKWFALQDYVQKYHGVDVVFLGNSMVNTGIDPVQFEDTYYSLSGEKLRVFNFGVEGLTVEPLSVLAQLINERYHPGTIILVTEMRDYIAGNGAEVTAQFMDNPWMRYQMGIPSLEGYLIEHTSFIKYLLAWRNWSSANFLDDLRTVIYRQGNVTPQGYEPDENQAVFDPSQPMVIDPTQRDKFQLAANFEIDPSRALNLQEIMSLNTTGTHTIVTEMPVYPTYFSYFGPDSVRAQYLQDLGAMVEKAGGVFVPAVSYDLIPLHGRVDDHHLNALGAPIYSELLAKQLYTACANHQTCIYPALTNRQP